MSTMMPTPEDYKFFDKLAPHVWADRSPEWIALARMDVGRGLFQIETILENALVEASNGSYTRVAEYGRDFTDGSDAKKAISQFRNNIVAKDGKVACWTNSITVSGLLNKKSVIRAMCYSKYLDEFLYYAFPYKRYAERNMIEIPLDNFRHHPGIPKGIPKEKNWTSLYRLESFERLAQITAEEVDAIEPDYIRSLSTTLSELY